MNDLFGAVRSLFAPQKKAPGFAVFRDSLENFEISYPERWKFDQDMAIVEGRYTISFQSPDGRSQFTVAVDAQLPWGFDFAKYAKQELESPTAGIYADAKKGMFRGMGAYRREYCYCSGGRQYFGGGIMFFNGDCVFSLSWSAPEGKKGDLQPLFDRMLESIRVKEPAEAPKAAEPRKPGARKPRNAKEPKAKETKKPGRKRR